MGTPDDDALALEAAPATEGQFVLTEEQAFDILAFLFSSAEICLVEPTYYGTFRLVDAASRMMGHMLAHDPRRSGDFLRRFKEEVDTKKVWMMWDREAYYEFLREAPAEVAAEVKRLEDDDAAGQETERAMTATADPAFADQVLALMKSRRVCRSFTDEPVSDADLGKMTEAARWATSGGNRHLHKFLVVRDAQTIRRVRAVSPGMLAPPPAMIVILTDLEVAERESLQLENDTANWMDVGTAAMNMMNVAHALGLGTCPVTSFSHSGAAVMLDLPPHLIPEWILIVGHPKAQSRGLRAGSPKPLTARELTYWERPGQHEP